MKTTEIVRIYFRERHVNLLGVSSKLNAKTAYDSPNN